MRRERIEWVDIWVTDAQETALPRLMMIGDSITRGYYKAVDDALKGTMSCARIAGSKFIGDPGWAREVELVLADYAFDVIHFNNGLHGWDYSEDEYADALPPAIDLLRRLNPQARLVWGQSTPIRVAQDVATIAEKNARVIARNESAAAAMTAAGIPVNDLYALSIEHADWHVPDGVHFNATGCATLGAAVVAAVQSCQP